MAVIRGIHFAATAITAGALIFRAVVTGPALGSAPVATLIVGRQILLIAGIGLAIAAASGLIWLQLQAVSMSGLPLSEAMTSDVLLTVVNETQFGLVSKIRCALAIILAVCLAWDRVAPLRWLGLGSAMGFVAAIAWTGHAGSTPGQTGNLHLVADALHLSAAAAWLGGLVPLALLLATARRNQAFAPPSLVRDAVQRFSALAIVSVGALLVTGIVNTWILVGSFPMLLGTEYGQLLTLKIATFATMLAFAALNRFWLTPQLSLSPEQDAQSKAVGLLARNSVLEIVLGLAIFAIVGVLGTLHPAIHFLNQ